jgi:hypothetical protein
MRERSRRQRGQDADSPNFAAQQIDLTKPSDLKYAATVLNMSKGKSRTAWDWYDKLGEIHYGVSRSARVGGYAELGVYKLERNGEIGEQVTTGLAGEIGDSFYSPYGGARGLVERFLTLMKIPADSYLIQAMNDGQPDGFDFVSADELRMPDPTAVLGTTGGILETKPGTDLMRITLPGKSAWDGGTGTALEERISPASFIGRVWRPSSRFVDLPDSPMGALDTECEMLHLLTVGLRSKLLSRLASNGIVYIPSEINDARSAAPSGEPGEFNQNKVLNELIKAALYAAQNPTSPEAAMPIFLSGPGIHAEQLKHIIMDQELYATDMKTRAELTERILVGLDIQPSQVKGHQTANHWSSWSASEDELRVSVLPDLETMCWALTRLVLWKRMQDAGQRPGTIQKLVVGFDMSKAKSHINVAEDARQLADRIMISPAATRNASGFEERDAPNDVEYIRMAGIAMGVPYLATYGMPEADKFDWTKVNPVKTGPNADSQAPDSTSQPGKGNPGSPSDSKTKTPARLRPAS